MITCPGVAPPWWDCPFSHISRHQENTPQYCQQSSLIEAVHQLRLPLPRWSYLLSTWHKKPTSILCMWSGRGDAVWQGPLSHYWITFSLCAQMTEAPGWLWRDLSFVYGFPPSVLVLFSGRKELRTSGMGSWYSTIQLHSAAVWGLK